MEEDKKTFDSGLGDYIRARRSHGISWLGKISFFRKKHDEQDIPEESVKKLLESKRNESLENDFDAGYEENKKEKSADIKNTPENTGQGSEKPQTAKKIEYSPEELKDIEERNNDAIEIMVAIEEILSLLPEDEKLSLQKSEIFQNMKKTVDGIK